LGLAAPESGEGIRPAIESGLLAAASILEGRPNSRLTEVYSSKIHSRFKRSRWMSSISKYAAPLQTIVARQLMRSHWFARTILLDRWFLNRTQGPLSV
jgi:flavin-dependent dehydrogenase